MISDRDAEDRRIFPLNSAYFDKRRKPVPPQSDAFRGCTRAWPIVLVERLQLIYYKFSLSDLFSFKMCELSSSHQKNGSEFDRYHKNLNISTDYVYSSVSFDMDLLI